MTLRKRLVVGMGFAAFVAMTSNAWGQQSEGEIPLEEDAGSMEPALPSEPSALTELSASTHPPAWTETSASTETTAAGEDAKPAKKAPARGDFDAGGQARFPNGPDEAGEYSTYNWIAVDAVGRYFLFDSVTLNGSMPLAIIKPDSYMGTSTKTIGGMSVRLEARLPKLPMQPATYKSDLTLIVSGSYMREGALLLSSKDFPLFVGGFQPGFTAGSNMRVKLSEVVDFSTTPIWVYQRGDQESLSAVQIPLSLIVKLGSLVQVSADAGVFTGDDYAFGGKKGGRIAAGGSLTVKIGPILAHAGSGVATLLTGGAYPTISDSLYVDLNVKYAK